jgi:hypothetical protein
MDLGNAQKKRKKGSLHLVIYRIKKRQDLGMGEGRTVYLGMRD